MRLTTAGRIFLTALGLSGLGIITTSSVESQTPPTHILPDGTDLNKSLDCGPLDSIRTDTSILTRSSVGMNVPEGNFKVGESATVENHSGRVVETDEEGSIKLSKSGDTTQWKAADGTIFTLTINPEGTPVLDKQCYPSKPSSVEKQ